MLTRVVVAALVLAGCTSSGQLTPAATAALRTASPAPTPSGLVRPRPLDSGWTRLEVPSEAFSLDVPPTWRSIDVDPARLETSVAAAARDDPALKDLFPPDTLRQLLAAGLKLFAFDADPARAGPGGVADLNVLKQSPGASKGLDARTQESVTLVESTLSVQAIVDRVALGGGLPASRIRYDRVLQTPAGARDLTVQQYFAVQGANEWLLTFTLPRAAYAAYADELDRIAKSFTAR